MDYEVRIQESIPELISSNFKIVKPLNEVLTGFNISRHLSSTIFIKLDLR